MENEQLEAEVKRPRKSKLLKWVLALGVLGGGIYLMSPGSDETQVNAQSSEVPGPDGQIPPPQDLLAQEMGAQTPPADPLADPPPADQLASGEEAMPIPPPVTSDPDPTSPAEVPPEVQPVAVPDPDPVPEEAPAPSAPAPVKPKKTIAKKAAKKYTLVFSRKGTQVPAGMKKDKVLTYLTKKLNGDTTCIPSSLKKNQLKPFKAIVTVSKTGAVTAVETKPKLPQAKSINACLKKKLAGNPRLFKVKGKNSKLTLALKVK